MTIKWKKPGTLKPDVILKRVEAARNVAPSGEISFTGFELHDALPVLSSMLDVPGPPEDYERPRLVWKAVARIKTALTPDAFLKAVNEVRKEESATKELTYEVLTSISAKPPKTLRIIRLPRTSARLLTKGYPTRYVAHRKKLLLEHHVPVPSGSEGYCNVILRIKAKNARQAARRALRDLDVLRAIWCLLGNHRMEIVGQEWKPINRVRLGPTHTLHLPDGNRAADEYWFEPSFTPSPLFDIWQVNFQKNANYVLRTLSRRKYGNELVEALARYVQALDESNQRNALIRLWSALEHLVLGPGGPADYELMVKRSASIFIEQERPYHHQILQHLRENRNQSVHAGTSEEGKVMCFQLQFYFFSMFLFLLNAKRFENLTEAREFMDLPPEIPRLRQQLRLIKAAERFRSKTPKS